ncbi:MAG TPA: UvrD-helicase domain-containing protein, partial [Bacteroidota bacterium]|nr:UvrD-helicase domain-containing protein [Bacteroidota bacterium]
MKSGPSTAADLKFPDFTLVTASAGSGKTHALTYRFLRFILSDRIPGNNLQNILAITFTNNAAREMKQRILGELKSASLGEEDVLEHLAAVGVDRADAKRKAATMVDYLLDHYSEFQVQTIDSFLSRVFRASALEFGYPPGVEILIDSADLLRQTFDEFARELAVDTAKRATLDRLVDMLLAGQADNSRYLWNPFEKISGEVRSLYNTLSQFAGDIASPSDLSRRRDELRVAILSTFEELRRLVAASRMEVNRYFDAVVDAAERKDIEDLIGRKSLYNPLLKKTGANAADVARWQAQCDPIQARMKKLADEFTVVSARTYYNAYAEALRYFRSVTSRISKEEGEITIADVNRLLAGMVKQDIVPEIYFYLGERINHYLIDEFQDTSPLQWSVFRPLAEESLSKKGSLFIVGDPKQSIYTFRGADWQIMRRLETGAEKFPSAPVRVEKLKTNFRSFEQIVSFNKEVFHTVVPLSDKKEAGRLSGLSDYEQHVKQEFKGQGHVEVIPIQDDP